MTEIRYTELENHLAAHPPAPVYLIHGEEMLCKTAYQTLLNHLIPPEKQSLSYEPVEDDNAYDALARINTFSLMAGAKVVGLPESRIFYSKGDDASLLQKARAETEADRPKKAARYLLSLMGLLGLSYDDITPDKRQQSLKTAAEHLGDGKWLDRLLEYCQEKNLKVPAPKDASRDLQAAVEKGFPRGHHLLISADMTDKRKSLFKAIKEQGLVVDCSVPKGERKADKTAQEAVLKDRMARILTASGKQMDARAFAALYEMTGFDLRTFSNNLEKLVNYVGDKKRIQAEDVSAVLKRTKQDPVFALSNAVADRNLSHGLFYLNSLLAGGTYPLQVLGLLVNQIRRLLVAKDFVLSSAGRAWNRRMNFNQFKTQALPALQKYDGALLKHLERWAEILDSGKKKAKPSTDLLLAKTPKNPFPIYQTLLKSENFSFSELTDALEALNRADLQLKTTGRDPRQVLEEAIIGICGVKGRSVK